MKLLELFMILSKGSNQVYQREKALGFLLILL